MDTLRIPLPQWPRTLAGLVEQLAAAGLGEVQLLREENDLLLYRRDQWTPTDADTARGVVRAYRPPPRRRPRSPEAIASDLAALTATARWLVIGRLAARLFAARPGLLSECGSDIPDEEDDPDPTP